MTKTDFPISKDARSFLEELLEVAGMSIVPPEVREKMLVDLAKRLDAKLTLAAISALPDCEIGTFEELLSRNAPVSKLTKFLGENVPNIADVYAQALVDFKKNYLHA